MGRPIELKTHACPLCRTRHTKPKVSRIPREILLAVVFIVVEVFIVLQLNGWLAAGMSVIIAVNVFRTARLIYGLSLMAAGAFTYVDDEVTS
jgi:uncharacterized membrane protein